MNLRAAGIAILVTALVGGIAAMGGGSHPKLEAATWLNGQPAIDHKVVAVEFWTFDCINCMRTVPAMRAIHKAYADRGLVVVGVHTPELEHERDVEKLRGAIARLDIAYPVAVDPDYAIWKSFDNQYWPTLYLLDKTGAVRYRHIGELHEGTPDWREVTRTIDSLLAE
jgi:thiol-disulfide isomerase/thioredoxin